MCGTCHLPKPRAALRTGGALRQHCCVHAKASSSSGLTAQSLAQEKGCILWSPPCSIGTVLLRPPSQLCESPEHFMLTDGERWRTVQTARASCSGWRARGHACTPGVCIRLSRPASVPVHGLSSPLSGPRRKTEPLPSRRDAVLVWKRSLGDSATHRASSTQHRCTLSHFTPTTCLIFLQFFLFCLKRRILGV